jgi:hypothetical protein
MATPNIGISALADGKFQTTVGGGPVHAPSDLDTAIMYAQRADKTGMRRANIPVWRGYEPYGYTTVAEFERIPARASMRSIERVGEIMPPRVWSRIAGDTGFSSQAADDKIAAYAAHYETWLEKPTTAQLKRRYLHRTFEDYLRTQDPMQAGKIAKHMNSLTRSGKKRIEEIDDWLYQGGEIRTDPAQVATGAKPKYWMLTPDGVFHGITPTERIYAEWQLYTT